MEKLIKRFSGMVKGIISGLKLRIADRNICQHENFM